MREIQIKDKVFLGQQKTPFRVIGFEEVGHERFVVLCTSSAFPAFNKLRGLKLNDPWMPPPPGIPVARRIPVTELVRDVKRRGWQERWMQYDFPFMADLKG